MTKRQWIEQIINGVNGVPTAQHWMSFFNGRVAKKLTPKQCHYDPMWLYDVGHDFDFRSMGQVVLDRMIAFNDYTGRCFACLGQGANLAFGHGGPGEFVSRLVDDEQGRRIVEFETGVRAAIHSDPHFYHIYDHPVQCIRDLHKLRLPDPSDPDRYAGFAGDAAYLKSCGEYVLASLNGFFSGIHYFFIEYQQTLISLIDDPELINAVLEVLGIWNLTAANKLIDSGADCIAICDDLGSKESLLMSPQQYRQFFKPWHKRLCQLAHDKGVRVHLHSHGAILPILDDLVDCGFDFINPFDPNEGFDIEQIVRKYGGKFVITGGIPTDFWYWQAERKMQYFEYLQDIYEKYGHFIWMDSGGVPENISDTQFVEILSMSRNIRNRRNNKFIC